MGREKRRVKGEVQKAEKGREGRKTGEERGRKVRSEEVLQSKMGLKAKDGVREEKKKVGE